MKLRFEINMILFLVLIVVTLVVWTAAEFYHRQGDVDIPKELRDEAASATSLPSSFDRDTLKKLYEGKDQFVSDSTTN